MMMRGRARMGYDQLRLRTPSQLDLHWRASDLTVQPVSGQTATFARASTAPGLDSRGVGYTAGHGYPAWAIVDGETHIRLNHGTVRENWRVPTGLLPTDGMVGLVELVDRGTANDAVLHVGAGLTTSPSLTVRQSTLGAWEVAVRHTGGLDVATAPPTTTPGDRVAIYWVLTPAGALTVRVRVGSGSFVSGAEVTGLALPAAWAAPEIRMGFITTAGAGRIDLRSVKLAAFRPEGI